MVVLLVDGHADPYCPLPDHQIGCILPAAPASILVASPPAHRLPLVQICWDGGDLVCCDQCPCAYHPGCLGISSKELEAAKTWKCPLHYCAECGKGSTQAGNMLFRWGPAYGCVLCVDGSLVPTRLRAALMMSRSSMTTAALAAGLTLPVLVLALAPCAATQARHALAARHAA
jgi:hypothetical protein